MATGRSFGSFFKEKRIELSLTLRQFCEKYNLDAGNISKMERGIFPPPKSEGLLKKYAKLLNLKEGTDDWYLFFDLAAAETGRFPRELMEKDVLKRMPLLFRTLRGKKLTKEKLDKLIRIIKES
ncbi:MAG: helix-turn-helix domain-containing protein [Candidatus Omnitrophica bacterium]|nr:helix-turn-helix domain-containing protein [Candidatus Omnitrophota bacterium]